MSDRYTVDVKLTHDELSKIAVALSKNDESKLANKFEWHLKDPNWIYSPPSEYNRGGAWWQRL